VRRGFCLPRGMAVLLFIHPSSLVTLAPHPPIHPPTHPSIHPPTHPPIHPPPGGLSRLSRVYTDASTGEATNGNDWVADVEERPPTSSSSPASPRFLQLQYDVYNETDFGAIWHYCESSPRACIRGGGLLRLLIEDAPGVPGVTH